MKPPATRLYVTGDLAAGTIVPLSDAQAHQLRAVLRLETGSTIALFNGRDGEWVGAATIEKRVASVQLSQQTRPQKITADIWLAFAPIKSDRMALLVEKATELGVARLLSVMTARTQGSNKLNQERLIHTAREAAEQCERLDVPLIDKPQKLETLIQNWDADRTLFVCVERGEAPPALCAFQNAKGGLAAIMVGPEGGFTPEEFALLYAQAFVVPITLGPTILRAETAAIAALACWQGVNIT